MSSKADNQFLNNLSRRRQAPEEDAAPVEGQQEAVVAAEAPVGAPEPAVTPTAASAPVAPAPGSPDAPGEAGLPFEDLPGVVRYGDELFLRDEGKLLPLDAPVKMTFTMTALERHRMRLFAEENKLSYVEVFKAGLYYMLGDTQEE